jgi:ABC-type Na+ efflux pump permease subunit
MVWIALALLGLTTTIVTLNTLRDRWGIEHWRYPRREGPRYDLLADVTGNLPRAQPAAAVQSAFWGATRAVFVRAGFYNFTNGWVLGVFLSFLLPIWSLSFATEAIGGERENGTLIWLLSQPIPRPMVYLAKYIAILPFSLGLNVGGFWLLCTAAGKAGQPAFALFWPAVVLATLAFTSLYHLMGALFRRPAVVAIVYSFFLETILGNMPGNMKRVSLGFYARCMMFDEAAGYGIEPDKPSIYLPVDGVSATTFLLSVTIVFLVLGMFVFSRREYYDIT